MTRRRRGSGGFSLVEVLVAAFILMVIALGLVPIFTRSIRSNVEGFDYTQVSNLAKSRAEEYVQYPFFAPQLTIPGGSEQLEVTDYFSDQQHRWVGAVSTGDVALFTRTTTVRQFGVSDLKTPLPGDAPPDTVHLKEITVAIAGLRPTALGSGKAIAVRMFKSQ